MNRLKTAVTVDDIYQFFAEHNHVFLYGAGKIANTIAHFLQLNGLHIDGCCVSHRTPQDEIEEVPIYEFPDIGLPVSQCGFILAMAEKYQREVEEHILAQTDPCGVLHLSPTVIYEINIYLDCELNITCPSIFSWHKELEKILSEPCILLKRERGLGDVLAFEPIARKLKKMGYHILVATKFKDVFRYNNVADAVFGGTRLPAFVERNCLTFDMTYAYALTPFSHIVDGYVDFVRTMIPDFSLDPSERLPIYDPCLIREHTRSAKKICVNNEATEWKSRIYDRDKMREFVLHLKRKGCEIYEIGGDEETYLGVGENCFGMELHDTVRLMSEMDLYVGLDNGLLHLAQSIHLPVFALFGCVCPLFRIHDWSRARVLWKNVDELHCAGCWSRRRLPCDVVVCDQKEHYCMNWTVQEVIEAFEKLEYNSPPKLQMEMHKPLKTR